MLSDLFNQVLVQYPSAREREDFAGHPLGAIVRNSIPNELKTCARLPDQYLVKGSVGQGGWAAVPWIAVMNKRVTSTTQDGIYIVYLFAEDGHALYLTLNQGCTETIKNHGRRQTGKILLQTAERLRSQLLVPQKLFVSGDVRIGNIFYEQGCIAYKCYDRNFLPSDDRLTADLKKFCVLYEQYCAVLHESKSGTKSPPAERIPFNLDEAIILLDAYLSSSKGDISKMAVAEEVSQKLRSLAISKNISINDAFRSPAGIQGRLRSIGAVYEGSESCAVQSTKVFAEAVNLYKNNFREFQTLLRKTTALPEIVDDKVPEVSAKFPIQTKSKERYDGSGVLVDKQAEGIEQEFFKWLSSTVSLNVFGEITKSYKLISIMLVQKRALPQPLTSITTINQVEVALRSVKRVFVNKKHRNTATKLLTAYITYLKGKSEAAPANNIQPAVEVQKSWIRFDFTNSQQFERTAPAYCAIGGHEITEKNWARVLVAITEMEIKNNNPKLQGLYTRSLMSQRKDRPFFLTDEIIGLHCAELSNGYWLNINYSIPRLMEQIEALCLQCEYHKDQMLIYGVPKGISSAESKNPVAPQQSSNEFDAAKIETHLLSTGLNGATIKEIIDSVAPGTAVYTMQKILDESSYAIAMPGGRYVHMDSFVDLDEAEETMCHILSTHFAEFGGYSNNQLLFGAATHDLSMFLNDNDCENIDSVFAIARFLFEKKASTGNPFKFYTPHIFEFPPDYPMTLKGLMIHLASNNGGVLLADTAKEYLQKTMLSYGSLGQLLQISTTDTFLFYDSERYLLTERIGIDDAWIHSLHDKMDTLFRQADVAYVIPRDISDAWLGTLPSLPQRLCWTQLLLQEVLKKFPTIGFRAITSELNQSYSTIAAAIVPADSPLQSFPDVVTLFMRERHTLPMKMTGENLRLELRDAGMLDGNELIYALPKALNDYRFAWLDENKTVYVRGN